MDNFFRYWNALYKNTSIEIERGLDASIEWVKIPVAGDVLMLRALA
jgi:hypothetical protein